MANFLSMLLGPNFAEATPAVFVLVLICCILFTYIIMKLKHIDKSLNNHITDTNKKIDYLREDLTKKIDHQREDLTKKIDHQREDFNTKFDLQREDFNTKFDLQREDFKEFKQEIKELIKSQHASHA